MKRVLVLAYFFPPLGGGGVQRSLKLVRYLEPNGWASTVVTAREEDYWILDPTLLQEIPSTAEVVRVGGLTSLRLVRLLSRGDAGIERAQERRDRESFRKLRRAQSWLLIPDGYRPWAREAQRASVRRIAAGGIDALWTTSSPESAHLAGLALKRRFGIPWVADFRDPWVGRVTYHPPTRWHDARHRELERGVVSSADRVTLVSDAMVALYRKRYRDLPAERFLTLPNGYDPDDWARAERLLDARPSQEEPRRRFVLLHAGQLAHRPSARTLLEAARMLISEDPRVAEELTIRFLGGNEELRPEEWERLGLGPVIETVPSLPHIEALAAMRRAEALVLLGHGGSADSLLYTGKIYEYLTSRSPVLGLVDPGPAADLIRDSGAGEVRPADDARGAAEVLRAWLDAWRRGEEIPARTPESMARTWDRARIAEAAARLLTTLAEPVQA
ncbi:MAG TPA: glycosyltransferase [Candidatus Eisenbacteria bacterium]|nr:glycosyltransferase [Candidatus Eisenbacteria bacterium]